MSTTYSINALSERLKVDRRTLKKYLAGIKPQDGGKYRLEDAEQALATVTAEGNCDLKGDKLREEIRKLRIRNDKEDGKLVLRAEVSGSIRRIYGALRQQIEQLLTNEYPTRVAGLDPVEARRYGKDVFDKIMAAHLAFESEWK